MSQPAASPMFRFQVIVPDVYKYMMDIDSRCNVSSLASYKNEVSGWVKAENVEYAKQKFAGFPIRFIESKYYWDNYDAVQSGQWSGDGFIFVPNNSEPI